MIACCIFHHSKIIYIATHNIFHSGLVLPSKVMFTSDGAKLNPSCTVMVTKLAWKVQVEGLWSLNTSLLKKYQSQSLRIPSCPSEMVQNWDLYPKISFRIFSFSAVGEANADPANESNLRLSRRKRFIPPRWKRSNWGHNSCHKIVCVGGGSLWLKSQFGNWERSRVKCFNEIKSFGWFLGSGFLH